MRHKNDMERLKITKEARLDQIFKKKSKKGFRKNDGEMNNNNNKKKKYIESDRNKEIKRGREEKE